MKTTRTQADDCEIFGYTWVEVPDDSVAVVGEFRPVGYATMYKVRPKDLNKRHHGSPLYVRDRIESD